MNKKNRLIFIASLCLLTPVSFAQTEDRSILDDARSGLNQQTAKQKVRQHTGYRGEDQNVVRRTSRGENCNVGLGGTYVEERRGGREVNVYSYAGDVNVKCGK